MLGAASSVAAQNVPVIGTDTTLDVGNWNVQWFGSTSGGPVNEALQQQNVANVITQSKMDLWGLVEVSDLVAWDTLLGRLPEYGGVISTWTQTQKTALLYRRENFRFLYQKHPLSASSYDFAGGRLPLEVGLEMNVNGIKDTVIVFVIHLKANTGDEVEKQASWQRRLNAAAALKSYVEGFGVARKCMVIGDWNDDMDSSVFEGHETPFSSWVSDTTRYHFPTLSLSLAKEKSMEAFTEVIDHQCVFGSMRKNEIPGSARVFNLKNDVSNYALTTSDHYPVYSKFSLKLTTMANHEVPKPTFVYPIIQNGGVVFSDGQDRDYVIMDVLGRKLDHIPTGTCLIQFDNQGMPVVIKLAIEP